MRYIPAFLGAAAAIATLHADTLYLRDGRALEGTFLSGTSREVRFLVRGGSGTSQLFPITSIDRLAFSSTNRSAAAAQRSASTGTRARTARYTVPAGTALSVRTIDAINSDRSNVGDTFHASLDEPVVAGGRTVVPKGADAVLRVVRVEEASGIAGREEVSLELSELRSGGRSLPVNTSGAQVSAKNRNSESIKVIGGTAVLGAIIGAIAGGGKGAAIGAASGAGAGAAIQAIRGQRVEIAPESILQFTLAQPLYID